MVRILLWSLKLGKKVGNVDIYNMEDGRYKWMVRKAILLNNSENKIKSVRIITFYKF